MFTIIGTIIVGRCNLVLFIPLILLFYVFKNVAARFASERSFKGWRCSDTVSPWSPSDSFCPLVRWLPTVLDHHALPQALTPPTITTTLSLLSCPSFLPLRCSFYVLEEVMAICLSSVCQSVLWLLSLLLSHSLICVTLLPLGFRVLCQYLNDILCHFWTSDVFFSSIPWDSLSLEDLWQLPSWLFDSPIRV